MKQKVEISGVELAGRIMFIKIIELNTGFNLVQIKMNNWQTVVSILVLKMEDGENTQ